MPNQLSHYQYQLQIHRNHYFENMWKKFNGSKDEIQQYYAWSLDALSSLKKRKAYKKLKYYFKLTFKK